MVITKKTITTAIATLLLIVVSIGLVSTISFSNSRKAQAVKLAEKHTRYFLENATDLETTVKNEEDILSLYSSLPQTNISNRVNACYIALADLDEDIASKVDCDSSILNPNENKQYAKDLIFSKLESVKKTQSKYIDREVYVTYDVVISLVKYEVRGSNIQEYESRVKIRDVMFTTNSEGLIKSTNINTKLKNLSIMWDNIDDTIGVTNWKKR